jgi:hypothetical protein
MAMGTALSGGCACGAVRYACTAEPLFALNCHCRDCQRETGSAFAPILAVPSSAFAVTRGIPRYFDVTADSGYLTRRAFCGECGSPLFGEPGSSPDMVTIRAGSLDDPGIFRPTQDIFVASAQPWDHMDPALPRVQRLPTG